MTSFPTPLSDLPEMAAAAAFATLIPGVLFAATLARRTWNLHPELARKSAHILLGLGTLSFPWIFHSAWTVWFLCVIAVLLLAASTRLPVLRRSLGHALGVERETSGEFWFPVAVAATFQLSGGEPLLFVVPILILTLADGLGALVGARYGSARYRAGNGFKSIEGSVAFFIVAFFSAHVPLLLMSKIGRLESLLLAALLGLLVMLMEAVAWRGLDNLFVPLMAFFLLESFLPLGAAELTLRLLLLGCLAVAALAPGRRAPLDGGALTVSLLFSYVFWALGGWGWLYAILALYAAVILLPRPGSGIPVARDLPAILRVMAGPTLYAAAHLAGWAGADAAFCLTFACHLGNVIASRQKTLRGPLAGIPPMMFAPGAGAAAAVLIYYPPLICFGKFSPVAMGMGIGASAACAFLFAMDQRADSEGRRREFREALFAPLFAAKAFLVW